MTPWISLLREAARKRTYILSQHAVDRMLQRDIEEWEVEHCCREGRVVETQEHGRDLKVLLEGHDRNGEPFYLVAALQYPNPVIVTVCRFQEDVWEDLGPFKRRRPQKP